MHFLEVEAGLRVGELGGEGVAAFHPPSRPVPEPSGGSGALGSA